MRKICCLLLALLLASANANLACAKSKARKDKKPPKLLAVEFKSALSINEANLNLPVTVKVKDSSGIQSIAGKFVRKASKSKKKNRTLESNNQNQIDNTLNKNTVDYNQRISREDNPRTKKISPSSITDSVVSTSAVDINDDTEEHVLNIPFGIDKTPGKWLLVLKIIDKNGNKKTFSSKKFKKLKIKNKLILNADPVTNDDDSNDDDDGDDDSGDGNDDGDDDDSSTGDGTGSGSGSGGSGGGSGSGAGGGAGSGGGGSGSGNNGPPPQLGDPVILADPPNSMIQAPSLVASQGVAFNDFNFLINGNNPIQNNVSPNAIDENRASIIRGFVFNTKMQPIENVLITVHKHHKYGSTTSFSNGEYNMVVNGGDTITVNFYASGFLPVQRTINVTSIRDFTVLDDIVLTRIDSNVNFINLTSGITQVAQTPIKTDTNGERQLTMIFVPGTSAAMVMSDGSEIALPQFNLRGTEYTVGEVGPSAMPADLPSTAGYGYTIELTIDEAVAAGAAHTKFSEPVKFYVDNYLEFPIGESIPSGFYDREASAWKSLPNGRIVKILNIENGQAVLDVDGSGNPASSQDLASLHIGNSELSKLAEIYQVGKELWRNEIPHFTPWSCNWPYGPPPDSIPPPPEAPEDEDGEEPDDPCKASGSIIGCQTQTLGEEIEIAGTPYKLFYQSDRVKDRKTGKSIIIPLSGDSLPASLKKIEVEIYIAGRKIKQSYDPEANKKVKFVWDGLDVYGRPVIGSANAKITVSYVYDTILYKSRTDRNQTYSLINTDLGTSPDKFLTIKPLFTLKIQKTYSRSLTNFDYAKQFGLGAWVFSNHHSYDVNSRKLFFGDGIVLSSQTVQDIIETVPGGSNLFSPDDVEVDSSGNIFYLDALFQNIWKISPEGSFTRVAGNGICFVEGNNIPATNACLHDAQGIALGDDGSIYIAERTDGTDINDPSKATGNKIRKVDPNGIITTIAGTGFRGYSGDGGPAIDARFFYPIDLDVGADGSVYVADSINRAIRKISPDGIIETVAGNGGNDFYFEGVPATSTLIINPQDVKVDEIGNIYTAESGLIRKISPDGNISIVAGKGFNPSDYVSGDGGFATEAEVGLPRDLGLAPDGTIYFVGNSVNHVRKISTDGFINLFAGVPGVVDFNMRFAGDGGPAPNAQMNSPKSVAVAPNGDVIIADSLNGRIRRVKNNLPTFDASSQAYIIADPSGEIYYKFDKNGKHLSTHNALTNHKIFDFGYDADGYLVSITDADNNITTIERSRQNISAIVSPDGQRTEVTLEGNGYLSSISNPLNETYSMTYTQGGLMTSFRNPRGNSSLFEYDNSGRLVKDTNAISGFQELSKNKLSKGFEVDKTTTLGRTINYKVETMNNGDFKLTNTLPDGSANIFLDSYKGKDEITRADGTSVNKELGGDPRFLMLSPIVKNQAITLPSGLSSSVLQTKTATLNNPTDILSLKTQTETKTINGRNFMKAYDAATKTFTKTSPAGRITNEIIDEVGRIIESRPSGLSSTFFGYDSRGRLQRISTGTGLNERIASFTYDSDGFLSQIIDPLGHTVDYTRDAIGRVTAQKLGPSEEINFAFDANSNLTEVTPFGKGPHRFSFTPVDLISEYLPPNTPGVSDPSTDYFYNLDKDLVLTKRPDGQNIDYIYNNSTGQLTQVQTQRGDFIYSYDQNSGQLKQITAPGNEVLKYTYDGFLLTKEDLDGTIDADLGITYDNNFFVTARNISGANSISFTYDADGILTRAGDLNITLNSQTGLATGTSLGSTTTAHTYNSFGEQVSHNAKFGASTLYNVNYTRDKLGRVTQAVETIQGTTKTYAYEYDAEKRLRQVSIDGQIARTYTYDSNGNRLSVSGSSSLSATYDAQDRIVSYGNNTYAFNAAGDLTTKTNTSSGAVTTYSYDAFGNLLSAVTPSGTQIDYVIDGRNRRIGKKVNGVISQGFVYKDQLEPIAELDAAGNVVSRFVYGVKFHVPAYMIKNPGAPNETKYLFVTDNVGSVRLVVDSSTGAIAQRLDYDEFGNVLQDTNPGFQPFGFAGGIYDRDLKLTRFGARDYDPETGRWTAKDPILFEGGQANIYVYVNNDPVNSTDINGLIANILPIITSPTNVTLLNFGLGYLNTLTNQNTDKFNHCMSNCNSTKFGGALGERLAKTASDIKENFIDKNFGGVCDPEDQAANSQGREGGRSDASCEQACGSLR